MDELVFWSERRLSEVGVAELNNVRELLALGVFSDDEEGAVMMKDRANIEAVIAMEVPRCTLAGLGMDENVAAEGPDGSGVVIEAAIKIFPG